MASEKQLSIYEDSTAAGFSRPLLLTPSEDLKGYIAAHVGRLLLFGITCVSVLAVLFIFIFVIRESLGFLLGHGLGGFLTSTAWHPESEPGEFGAVGMITGSVYVTVCSLLVAVPIGLLAAVFLSDIAPFKVRQYVKPIIEILAAIPSVAYGFFALLVLSPLMQNELGFTTGTNILNASVILAVMALPTIISVAEDSLSAIGREIREASYGLGATRAETIIKVVIPAAHSGIIAAVILGMMRAVGETMVVWMAAGNANQIPSPWWNLSAAVRTMTATIAGDMGETVQGSMHYRALFAIGLLLLAFTFTLNMISEHLLARARRVKGGGK
ncbi:MAG: phosphate ABC transporter permease subunit PstC [Sedimentisphaerales bacterium]|nr:phosphate ABC transporter permease subunit PstC [Sedimentisphaerales bacterium]